MPHLSSEDFALSEADDEVSVSLGRYVYDSHSMVYVWFGENRKGPDLSVALLSVERMRELAAWLLDFAERYEQDAAPDVQEAMPIGEDPDPEAAKKKVR